MSGNLSAQKRLYAKNACLLHCEPEKIDIKNIPQPVFTEGGLRYVLTDTFVGWTITGGKAYCDQYLTYDPRTGKVTARPGFTWDGCSIPWYVPFISRTEATKVAGLLHDIGYILGQAGVFEQVKNAREKIDAWFFWNLRWRSVPHWKCKAMYKAVCLFGRSHFQR